MPFHLMTKAKCDVLMNTKGKHSDGKGLYLQVAKPGQASWQVQYRFGGRTRWMTIGPADLFDLKAARDKHQAIRTLVKGKVDPRGGAAAEAAQATGTSFGDTLTEYLREASPNWKGGPDGKEAKNYRRSFDQIPDFLKLSAADIQPADTRAALTVWPDKSVIQRRMRTRIKTVLKFGEDGEIRFRKKGLPVVVNHPSLPYVELPKFMAGLLANRDAAARALAFTILCASRTEEVLGMTWGEVAGDVWVIEADRMKSERQHRVPLSSAAIALLGDRGAPNEYVFTRANGRKLRHTALREALAHVRPEADVTVHGFRSTFRTWAAEQTDYGRDLAEWSLAHAVFKGVEAIYAQTDMLDKRRPLMADWTTFAMSG